MKKKIIALLLISTMLFPLAACAGNKEASENITVSSEITVAAEGETGENTVSKAPKSTQKEKNSVSITSNPMDGEYFAPATDDWFLFSQNGCFADLEELDTDALQNDTPSTGSVDSDGGRFPVKRRKHPIRRYGRSDAKLALDWCLGV